MKNTHWHLHPPCWNLSCQTDLAGTFLTKRMQQTMCTHTARPNSAAHNPTANGTGVQTIKATTLGCKQQQLYGIGCTAYASERVHIEKHSLKNASNLGQAEKAAGAPPPAVKRTTADATQPYCTTRKRHIHALPNERVGRANPKHTVFQAPIRHTAPPPCGCCTSARCDGGMLTMYHNSALGCAQTTTQAHHPTAALTATGSSNIQQGTHVTKCVCHTGRLSHNSGIRHTATQPTAGHQTTMYEGRCW
jgi:hypothetical protein